MCNVQGTVVRVVLQGTLPCSFVSRLGPNQTLCEEIVKRRPV